MSWTTTRTTISALITGQGFTVCPEMFDIEKSPSSLAGKLFCLQLDEMNPNKDGFGASKDRFFPTQRIRISVIYDLFIASQTAYDEAVDENMKLIQALINPDNRGTGDIRMIEFSGSRSKLFENESNWLIIDNFFDMQVQVTFLSELMDNSLVAGWQNGSLIDVTGRGNDLVQQTYDYIGCEIDKRWLIDTTYSINDLCFFAGHIWKSLQDNNIGNSPTENTYWTDVTIISGLFGNAFNFISGFKYGRGALTNSPSPAPYDTDKVDLQFSNTTGWSMACWINIRTFIGADDNAGIISKLENRYVLTSQTVNKIGWVCDQDGFHEICSLTPGQWYLVVATYDPANNTFYFNVNNQNVASCVISLEDQSAEYNAFYLGFGDDRGTYLDGIINAVWIWKRKLTENECSELWNNGNGQAVPIYLNLFN